MWTPKLIKIQHKSGGQQPLYKKKSYDIIYFEHLLGDHLLWNSNSLTICIYKHRIMPIFFRAIFPVIKRTKEKEKEKLVRNKILEETQKIKKMCTITDRSFSPSLEDITWTISRICPFKCCCQWNSSHFFYQDKWFKLQLCPDNKQRKRKKEKGRSLIRWRPHKRGRKLVQEAFMSRLKLSASLGILLSVNGRQQASISRSEWKWELQIKVSMRHRYVPTGQEFYHAEREKDCFMFEEKQKNLIKQIKLPSGSIMVPNPTLNFNHIQHLF